VILGYETSLVVQGLTMNDSRDSDQPADILSAPGDTLDAGLAAGFGQLADGSRSTLARLHTHYGALSPVLLREVEGDSAHVVRPKSDAMPESALAGDRYQLSGEIARGGMGAVLRGRDVELGRELAFKVLLEKYVTRPDIARRFVEEAQIGGQLQHPGVVPVYDIGSFGERPFFTMKLVKGRTLASILGDRTDPTQERPRLLAIALQVAQTLAYAHAKGVIHRDLKPANIMVGAFGEVQVMDWGLAKVLAEGGIADEELASRAHRPVGLEPTVIRTARSGSAGSAGTDTEAGSLLGTPAYMPPEQANGFVEHLDRRSDVFGLGAILCEIVTAKPPYVGRSGEEVRRKAANGDLADARDRLAGCEADAELTTLIADCLAPEAIDRPKDAQAVTVALTAYLDGVQERSRRADLDRAAAEARTEEEVNTRRMAEAKAVEERKRRRTQLALAASVLALIGLAGGVFWWQQQQQLAVRAERATRQASTSARIGESLVDARQRIAEAWEKTNFPDRMQAATGAAEAALRRADQYAVNGLLNDASRVELAAARPELEDLIRHTRLVVDYDWILQQFAKRDEDELGDFVATSARRHEAAMKRFGIEPLRAPEQQVAQAVAADRLRDTLLGMLSTWQLHATDSEVKDRLGRVIRIGRLKCGGVYARWQDLMDRRDWKGLVELASSLEIVPLGPHLTNVLSRDLLNAAKDEVSCRNLLRVAADRYPNAIWIHYDLAFACRRTTPPELIEALQHYGALVALKPDAALFRLLLAQTYLHIGSKKQAIREYQKAVELGSLESMLALGHLHLEMGDADAAIACYRVGIERIPNSVTFHTYLASALRAEGRSAEAQRTYTAAVRMAAEKLARNPKLALNDDAVRYNAACSAVLAAGEWGDTVKIDEKERLRLRQQALSWLRAALEKWTILHDNGQPSDSFTAAIMLQQLLQDGDFASIRDKEALARLPAKERQAFEKFWADAESLFAKAKAPSK
jgi:eukaryotic-like serine/threonine-protein kinase